jgi:hypothetical protein
MSNEVEFLSSCARINELLSLTLVELQENDKFVSVEKNCLILNPDNPILSMAINASLKTPLKNDLHTFGLSFSIEGNDRSWKITGEIGWSSYQYGFEEEVEIEYVYGSMNDLLKNLDVVINNFILKYKQLISQLI